MRKILLALAVLLAPLSAYGQSVQYTSPVTPNHVPVWITGGVIGDGGTASDSPISSLGITNNGGQGLCVSTGRSTAAGRQQLCLSASLGGAGTISLQNYGTAVAQNLRFLINGTEIIIPTGGGSTVPTITTPLVNNDAICADGINGILKDCGVAIAAGTQYGVPYYSTSAIISSTVAGTAGQLLVGQSTAPLWKTISGDVSTISAAGALTLGKVNGIPFAATYGVHGVLLGQGTSQFNSLTTSNVGQCLLSQGTSSDPIWSSCAAGSGSAGGSNTQVQFNNSTSLGGNANLTWVSPALTIGVAGTTTGQLALAPAGNAAGTVTVQNPSTTSAYNFNLPTTAGSSGQALLSGGGGSTAMSFGTLGVAAGGTNCSSATGTCLDNITGFSSTGYINRTGGGTYAFSTVIPVSGGGTNLANGTSGGILGFTASGTIASSALLTQFGVVVGGGAGSTPTAITPGSSAQILIQQTSANPSWNSVGGDATMDNTGAVTIANSAITNAKLANAAAFTFKGNATSGSAAPTDFTPASLSNKASPAAGDYIVIADNAAAGALKYATVSSIAVAGSVADVGGLTGSVGVTNGIDTTGNSIEITAARRTLPTIQTFTSSSGTYTRPSNVLWLEILLVGGGSGGGSGNGNVSNAGGNTCWNTTGAACTTPVYQASGAAATAAASTSAVGAVGGGVTGSSTCNILAVAGSDGDSATIAISGTQAAKGGNGGASSLGGSGSGGLNVTAGVAAKTNSGSGGGGGGETSAATAAAGSGGAGGGTCRTTINSPASTYTYAVGAGGAGNTSPGTGGANGGAGAAGLIVVIEHYGT